MSHPTHDWFALFGLPQQYDIDLTQLEKQYFTMQQTLHPDRFANKSAQEKLLAVQKTADINQAYETLKSPLLRAEHLLSLHGIAVNTEQGGAQPSQEVLLEALEQREKLESATTPEAVHHLERETGTKKQHCEEALAAAFKNNAYDNAASQAIALKYLDKFTHDLRLKHRELEEVS